MIIALFLTPHTKKLLVKGGFTVVEIFPWKMFLTIVIGRDKFSTDGNLKS